MTGPLFLKTRSLSPFKDTPAERNMPPRGAPRRSSRAASPDHLYSRSTRSTPSSTSRQTRRATRATRASTVLEAGEDSPTSNGTASRASTPESNNEPVTPQDERVEQEDAGSDLPSGRPSRKRTRTTKAIETEEALTSRRRTHERNRKVEEEEEEEQRKKRQDSTTVQPLDGPDSPLTDYDEPQGPPPRKKQATAVVEVEERVGGAAPPSAGQDEDVQPPPKESNLAPKGRKQNWRFDFQSASSSPEDPQPTPLPPLSNAAPPPPPPVAPVQRSPAPVVVKKPGAPAIGRGGIKGKGKKVSTSLLARPSKDRVFELILYDDPFASLEAYLRPPLSPYHSTRPSSSTPLRPLSVTRSTTPPHQFVAYRFSLPSTADGTCSIERVVVKVVGKKGKVRGPNEAEQAAMLERGYQEKGEAAEEGDRVGRWLLCMSGEETRWLLR